jgi:NAD(P)-dependent dehydrogenase (short-subunit alcohol dehydrogenase family)
MTKKLTLLTGASGRFGKVFTSVFSEQYEFIALSSNQVMCNQNNASKSEVKWLHCDLANTKDIIRCVNYLSVFEKNIERVIFAAADTRFLGRSEDFSFYADDALEQYVINVLSPAIICSELFRMHWRRLPFERSPVSILNVSSLSGVDCFTETGQASYAASKSALNMLTRHMSADYSDFNIRVNAVSPGSFLDYEATSKVAVLARKILETDVTGKNYALGEAT